MTPSDAELLRDVKRYEPNLKYIGTGEYVPEMEEALKGEYVLACDYDALRQENERLIDVAVQHIENHSCVSTCCNAQPSAGEAKALADCLRHALTKAGQT